MRLSDSVVVGGSVAGLLAAAALSAHSDTVTVIEKDELPDEPVHRRAVGQGLQVHALLGAGQAAMERLVPGVVEDMVRAGGVLVDSGSEIVNYGANGWGGRVPTGTPVICIRRFVLEWALRRRVLALPNVRVVRAIAAGPVVNDGAVTGVRLKGADRVRADLVVDASGRSSKMPEWLSEHGYPAPEEQQLRSHIGYATVPVRLPVDAMPEGVAGVLAHPNPGNTKGGAVVPCDSGLHLLAGLGMMNDDPPGDWDGLLAHVDRAASPLIGRIARKAVPAGEIATWRMPGSRRRLWERVERVPDRLLMIGDSVMSFNPIYGQGMSVAAVEAATLASLLADLEPASPGFAREVQAAFAPTIDAVFGMVVGVDALYDGAELEGLEPPAPEQVSAGRALSQLATEDVEASLALKHAAHFFDTAPLRSPSIQAKLRAWIAEGRAVAHTDPTVVPPLLA